MAKSQTIIKTHTHALKSPYSDPVWPTITPKHEAAILNLLLPILLAVGQSRDRRVRSTDRKSGKKIRGSDDAISDEKPQVPPWLTVGFNSTMRQLERISQPNTSQPQAHDGEILQAAHSYCAIFVSASSLPEIMSSPLQLLAAFASQLLPEKEAIRLVPLSLSGASKIAEALGQPRANVVGLSRDAPGADELEALLAQDLEAVVVPWTREASESRYRPVQIHSTETTVGPQAKVHERSTGADTLSPNKNL